MIRPAEDEMKKARRRPEVITNVPMAVRRPSYLEQ
jgi:hypothetical protein